METRLYNDVSHDLIVEMNNNSEMTDKVFNRTLKSKALSELWRDCLKIIRDNVTESIYSIWFSPIKPQKFENGTLTLKVPSEFFKEWIEENYFDLLIKTVTSKFGISALIQFEVVIEKCENVLEDRVMKLPVQSKPQQVIQKTLPFEIETEKEEVYCDNLNNDYKFSNFIPGDINQFAANAAWAVSKSTKGNKFSPLFLYGKSGLGKTHLLQAIGNEIKSNFPKLKVMYVFSQTFQNQFTDSVMNNTTNKFLNFYRKLDVLLIDDVQFWANKGKTQENFFHIFNELHQAGKLIVITSDRPTKELHEIDERLRTRFSQGLFVDIKEYDLETRMAIIRKKSIDSGLELPYDIAEYVAANVGESVRELEGALVSLMAASAFDNRTLDLDLAKEVIGRQRIEPKGKKAFNIDLIKDIVSEHFGIDIEDMESNSRKHEIALARQMAMYLAKNLTRLSLKNIGAAFGGRDHSTVLHSLKTIDNYLFTDSSFKNEYQSIHKKCLNYIEAKER